MSQSPQSAVSSLDSPAVTPRNSVLKPGPRSAKSFRQQTAASGPQEAATPDHSRKRQGGLRPAQEDTVIDDGIDSRRQIQVRDKSFPKRVKIQPGGVFHPQESSLCKFIVGVWQQIHAGAILEPPFHYKQAQPTTGTGIGSAAVTMSRTFSNFTSESQDRLATSLTATDDSWTRLDPPWDSFNKSNVFCRRVTQTSRTCRSIEVIVQARWVELFDSYVDSLALRSPGMSQTKCSMVALTEACNDFGWTEKEVRNKMAIWRGYKEIKDAGGWVALVFSGMGLYRLCKYRIDFDKDRAQQLRAVRLRMEVAADTLHPDWRQLLAIVGEPTQRRFTGHPHDWVIYRDGSMPVPLRSTYLEKDPGFSFEHVQESIIDATSWRADDPRWTPPLSAVACSTGTAICDACGQVQSENPQLNYCKCFLSLFGGPRLPCPVQVFRTSNGRNNGLQALVPFERGIAIGEFVGLVTKGLEGQDVMDSEAGGRSYQIWQGKQGNYTRFVNHSCRPNAQFQRFVWIGTQHVILVSKGIEAGMEITVDYSGSYWKGLDKRCLCGESCCRYDDGG